jgi:DNA (cytosine-5)-methyltransferase 1
MIFKPVTKIKNKTEKDFCVELTQVYRRLVEVYCQKNGIPFLPQAGKDDIAKELCEIGITEAASDMDVLKVFLGKEYAHFAEAVSFAAEHKTELKTTLFKLYNSYRKKAQKGWANKPLRIVDFFCGAGGLSLGFIHEGFNIALANDIEDVCIQTYTYNHPELPSQHVIQGDIKTIVDNVQDYIVGDIDVVVGGPPCQGFSEANRQRIIDDPRNELYKYFVKAVERIAPKFVVMENVKGMMKVADQVVEDYERLSIERNGNTYSYRVAYRILNSQNFCVAQSRERLIYIAVRSDVMDERNITPEKIFDEIFESTKGNPTFILADALADIKPLEAPRVRNTNEIDSETTGKKIDVNAAENHSNAYLDLINRGRKIPYLFNHKARYCSDVNYEIYKRLNPGDDATDEKIKDIMPYAHRNHCFKDKYFKLHADRPCRTITAHLRMDCHSHIHPYQIRSLTPREAARAQSFPDDYMFLGAYLKTYMQIGNAVPTLMANGIAKVIKKYLI